MFTAAKVWLFISLRWVRGVSGFFQYQANFPNGGNVVRNGQAWPGVGHTQVFGGGTRNSFGVDFAASGHQWTEALCRKDSDGDGQSNGLELGDPDCVWILGDIPARTDDISHPGYADSLTQAIPTRTPAKPTSTIAPTVTETTTIATVTTVTITTTASTIVTAVVTNTGSTSTSIEATATVTTVTTLIITATTTVSTAATTVTSTTKTSTAAAITSTANATVINTATTITTQGGTIMITEATTTAAGTTTTGTSTRFAISHVQGNLVLAASYSTIFGGDAPLPRIKAALVAAIAEIAGVDISVVVVTLTLPHRLQSETLEISIACIIIVTANEAAAVVERITSTDLDSATAVVAQHLSNAGIDGAVKAVNVSANIAAGDVGTIVKDLLALWIGAGIGCGIGVLLAVLCYCWFHHCCCHGSGKAGRQSNAPAVVLPTLISMEEGKGDKHVVYSI